MPTKNVITERCALTSLEVFTRINIDIGHINEEQFQKLCSIEQSIPRPTCFIYLKLNVNDLITRIKERGRKAEKNMSIEYLLKVEEKQELFIAKRKEPVLVLDARKSTNILLQETLDFLKNHAQI